MRDRQKSADLLKSFREIRKQVQGSVENSVESVDNSGRTPRFSRGYSSNPRKSPSPNPDRSKSFMEKYANLEATIDTFTTSDLMYFFREKARENGVKYVIANMKRDMGIFKKLLANYSQKEICLMIEFIFSSEQNYLDKSITQPTVLASSYCNKIYRDSLLWVDDKYDPNERDFTSKSRVKSREWNKEVKEEKAKIGEW